MWLTTCRVPKKALIQKTVTFAIPVSLFVLCRLQLTKCPAGWTTLKKCHVHIFLQMFKKEVARREVRLVLSKSLGAKGKWIVQYCGWFWRDTNLINKRSH